AYGGPDAAHDTFTPVQRAISYSMTSPFTTGGIRGNKSHIGTFHPRSFNMGVSRKVWEQIGGFKLTRLGEDIEYRIRIQACRFNIGLIPDEVVNHKIRTDFRQFYKQLHLFGRARINIYRHFPAELKLVHFFPAFFVCFVVILLLVHVIWMLGVNDNIVVGKIARIGEGILGLYTLLIFVHSLVKTHQLRIAMLSVAASYVQLTAY